MAEWYGTDHKFPWVTTHELTVSERGVWFKAYYKFRDKNCTKKAKGLKALVISLYTNAVGFFPGVAELVHKVLSFVRDSSLIVVKY